MDLNTAPSVLAASAGLQFLGGNVAQSLADILRGALTGCSSAGARAAAASKKKRKPPRRLWGSDSKGKFRTRGGNSVATVRGTAWYVEDRCDGTRTDVGRGKIAVVASTARSTKSVTVKAGRSYLVKARLFSALGAKKK